MITNIRSDHSGEFQNEHFEIFYDEHCIAPETFAPKTP